MRIDDDDRTFLSFELLSDELLQIAVDRRSHVLLFRLGFFIFEKDLPRLRHQIDLFLIERPFKSRRTAFRPQQMGHFSFERVGALNITAFVDRVIGESILELSGSVEHPASQRCRPRSAGFGGLL